MKLLISIAKYIFLLGIGVFLMWLAARGMNTQDLMQSVKEIDYFYIAVAFVIAILSHLLRGLRWSMLIKPLGYNVSGFNSFLGVMVGYLANLALPRMGEVSRCLVLNKTNKVPVDKLIGTVITERLVDFLSLLLILLLNFALEFDRLWDFFSKAMDGFMAKKATTTEGLFTPLTILAGLFAIGVFIIIATLLYKKIKTTALFIKVRDLALGFISGMKTIGQMKNGWLFISYSVLLWLAYYLQIYICFFALGFTSHLGLIAALSVLTIGSFGFVMPVQGGIGAYHIAVTAALMLYGLTQDQGMIFATVAHAFQTIIIILVGSFSFLALVLLNKKIKPDTDEQEDNQLDTAKAIQ